VASGQARSITTIQAKAPTATERRST
jgi:hypothetical protein